jgi:hypothetical protein
VPLSTEFKSTPCTACNRGAILFDHVFSSHRPAQQFLFRSVIAWLYSVRYPECFKKSFTTLKAYIIFFRAHVQCSELS